MSRLFTAHQIRLMDQMLINEYGIPGLTLMSRAADASVDLLRKRYPLARRVIVFCGTGNNAGDGYLVAAKLQDRAVDVLVVQVGDPQKLGEDASTARDRCAQQAVPIMDWDAFQGDGAGQADVLVDALLGLGTTGPAREPFAQAIEWLNTQQAPVIALDVPSGLHPDFGVAEGAVVHASHTVTFIALKLGLAAEQGPDFSGEVCVAPLGAPDAFFDQFEGKGVDVIEPLALPPRSRAAHKGHFGHVLVVAGGEGMAGAGLLAASAALRTGAGLVTLATHPSHAPSLAAYQPELMIQGVSDADALTSLLERATVVAVGPGLGQSQWSEGLLNRVMDSALPMVMDADALNMLAERPSKLPNAILTPHPKEAARMLGAEVVRPDRLEVLHMLQDRYQSVVVLKGAATLVHDGKRALINGTGSPAMATAGMGDALTGCIAGLVAQGLDLGHAAAQGVAHHGRAGEWAAADLGEVAVIASDVIARLGRSFRGDAYAPFSSR